MDEWDLGLNSGDYLTISQIVSKLIRNIQIMHEEDPNKESAELKFLKEKCTSFSDPVSQVACKGLLYLIEQDVLALKTILPDFISIITTTKCSSNMVFLINSLLIEEMQKQISSTGKYQCNYSLRLPQHPLVTMLIDNSSCWFKIFNEMVHQEDNLKLRPFTNDFYKPIYLLVFCNPNDNQQLCLFKLKLWSFLIYKSRDTNNCILNLLGWMQMQPVDSLRENADLLVELAEVNFYNKESEEERIEMTVITLFLISYLWCTTSNHLESDFQVQILTNILDNEDDEIPIINAVLLTLSKIIPTCSSLHIEKILELCGILSEKNVHPIILQALKVSLLPWIASPSLLTSEIVSKSTQLFALIENNMKKLISNRNCTKFFGLHNNLTNTTHEGCISIHLSALVENWQNDEDVLQFVQKLEEAPTFFMEKIIHFLFGIFTSDFRSSEIHLRLFKILLKCGNDNKVQSRLLTILIYKLSNTNDSQFHHELLKSLPKLAKSRDGAQKVLGIVQTLSKRSGVLGTFGVTLMFDLWKTHSEYYPQLENLLIRPYDVNCKGNLWEFYVTRAYILREICKLKPEIHGTEMVPHLSKILNECHDGNGALASALAIEGIAALCKVGIVDAVTTWETLAPIFKNDTRVPVIKSLCGFFAEIPHLSSSETDETYSHLTREVIKSLWDYVRQTTDAEIWQATLSTLSVFNVEDIMAQIPEEYVDDEDSSNLKKGVHSTFEPIWINLLRKSTEVTMHFLAEHFLVKMVSLEIDGYLKYVYQVKGVREPNDYSTLPANSIVRSIGGFLKFNAQKWTCSIYRNVYLECLNIFSHVFSKPLPPLNWCFLQEVMQVPEAKNYCISIASHQVMLSGTARRLIENYITALTENYENEEDVLHLYKHLQHISNSIQPATLKPFLELTILKSVESFKNSNEDYLKSILKCLKGTLEHKGIQDTNKSVIADILTSLVEETEDDSKMFMLILDCVEAFPSKNLSQISSPKTMAEMSSKWLRKAVKIRCRVALNAANSPLNWLNDVIEVGHKFEKIVPFVLKEFSSVFKSQKDNTDSALWLLDFIGQIQASIADKSEMAQILFQCEVFMVATLIFSGYFVFIDDLSDSESVQRLFPQAIATLIDVNHWSICANQALEWFYHMNSNKMFPMQFRKLFGVALQALRHEDEFKKNMKWMKYLTAIC